VEGGTVFRIQSLQVWPFAATPEITVIGGLGDERMMHIYRESVGAVMDGANEIRKYVRTMCREGCDIIKLNISGNNSLPNAPATSTLMTRPEIDGGSYDCSCLWQADHVACPIIGIGSAQP